MFEVAPPLPWCELRAQQLEQLVAQHTCLQQAMLVLGQYVVEFEQLHPLPVRQYVPDELSLLLGQSPQSMRNLFLDAHQMCAHPVVIELVGSGQWSIRHADAALRALLACELTPAQQDTVLAMVGAQRQARMPYLHRSPGGSCSFRPPGRRQTGRRGAAGVGPPRPRPRRSSLADAARPGGRDARDRLAVPVRLLLVAETVPSRDPRSGDGSSMISDELLTRLPTDVVVELATFVGDVAVPAEVAARCLRVHLLGRRIRGGSSWRSGPCPRTSPCSRSGPRTRRPGVRSSGGRSRRSPTA